MGCFLGCFGFTTKKQKRIKPCNKFQVHQKYVQLDSEKANAADSVNSEPRDKPKESSKPKVKKKVSFNLNVKAYERIQDDDNNSTYFSDEEKKTQREYNEQETAKSSMSMYPSSYRYYNCNYEEDEITLEESDIDDLDEEDYGVSDDDDDDDDDDNEDGGDETQNKYENDKRLNKDETYEVGQDHRNVYGNSVLLPVENLTQWKAVKARGAQQVKHQKENIIKSDGKQEIPLPRKPVINCADLNPKENSKPKPQEIAVDTSLSNWLVSAGAATVNR
ncbi:PREDICTED: histone H2A.Z-specific chaperone CHZ1 [Nicotiana attenuata]|uniref:Uncharacterized protein n=1 Tax=Nicotiana attenuata TaxID=49451 RepID=A0A314KNL8_NICAT|nr:PREDICTED: histone H2A.Z-specific chaperone CHZ1 [Nicotiana attenuata]OIT30832.1 hypothetical protein A4A49_19622 [Nicotiana attenuata]